MGGITKVGCKFTKVWRKDANSEYLRRTSRSYIMVSYASESGYLRAYACPNGVRNVVASAFRILASVGDQNLSVLSLV